MIDKVSYFFEVYKIIVYVDRTIDQNQKQSFQRNVTKQIMLYGLEDTHFDRNFSFDVYLEGNYK
jgi:hypothetical protein